MILSEMPQVELLYIIIAIFFLRAVYILLEVIKL